VFLNSFKGGQTGGQIGGQTGGQIESLNPQLSERQIETLKLLVTDLKFSRK
jgi:hypothetical protein